MFNGKKAFVTSPLILAVIVLVVFMFTTHTQVMDSKMIDNLNTKYLVYTLHYNITEQELNIKNTVLLNLYEISQNSSNFAELEQNFAGWIGNSENIDNRTYIFQDDGTVFANIWYPEISLQKLSVDISTSENNASIPSNLPILDMFDSKTHFTQKYSENHEFACDSENYSQALQGYLEDIAIGTEHEFWFNSSEIRYDTGTVYGKIRSSITNNVISRYFYRYMSSGQELEFNCI